MKKNQHHFPLIKILISTFIFSLLVFFQTKVFAKLPQSLRMENLPTLQSGPPLSIQAAYDKEVLLKVTASDDFSSQNSKIIWSINNKKICTGLHCSIVIKESDYQNSAPILQVITYNEYGGTTYTYEFKIHSKEEFNSKSLNKEMNYTKNSENSSNSLSTQSVSAVFGKGTFIQSDYILYIGSLSRSFNWNEGIFQTDNLDTLRIADSESGLWFLLPSSNLSIKNQSDKDNIRRAELDIGNLRVKASSVKNDTNSNIKNFSEKIEIETQELKVTVPSGGDVVITRENENEKIFTRVIVLSGKVYLKINKEKLKNTKKFKNEKISLGTGFEFKIYEDGTIKPLSIPNNSIIENFIAFTTTQEELQERKKVSNIDNLSEILDKAAILADGEEYFELLNLLTPIQNHIQKDIRIPYYLGIAKKGLYQIQEAKKYFLISKKMDNNFSMAHWQLGLIYLEEKSYPNAEYEFLFAHKNLPSKNKVAHEYNYYIGISYFFNNKLLLAKNTFQTAVSDTELDPSLRQSAADFLKKIDIEKPWSLIVPIGIQYDDNVLSLAQNQSLPIQYSQKSDYRSIFGALYTYDSSKDNRDNGWFLGGAGKAFYVKNYPDTYNSLNATVLEGSIYETKRWEKEGEKKEKDSIRIYQTAGAIFVDNIQDSLYFLGGAVYKSIELNAGLQFDVSDRPSDNQKNGLIFNQYYQMGLGQYGPFVLDLNLQGQEQLMFQTSDTIGNTLEFIATPSATYSINPKANVKLSHTFDFLYNFISPVQSTYKFIPSAALNYFFLEWLIGTFSASYEYDRIITDSSSDVFKPGASIMVTGIF